MAVVAKISARTSAGFIYQNHPYDEDHPAVIAHPDLFESAEDRLKNTARPKDTIELGDRSALTHGTRTARQEPGEARTETPAKRGPGRPRKN